MFGAGEKLDIPVKIVMPNITPEIKIKVESNMANIVSKQEKENPINNEEDKLKMKQMIEAEINNIKKGNFTCIHSFFLVFELHFLVKETF